MNLVVSLSVSMISVLVTILVAALTVKVLIYLFGDYFR